MRMTLQEICAVLQVYAPVPTHDIVVTGASMDSRTVTQGDMFVCIVGERVDGHDYAKAAVQAGAVAVLASRPPIMEAVDVPVLVVPDTIVALGAWAQAWRRAFRGKLVGVTGSAGKTTVKEVLAQVLSVHGATARNIMNFNNNIGMPLSVLNTTGEEDFWVMEVGISQAHDMDELAAIVEPDIALIINAGGAHTEGLGDKGVAHHKARLLAYMRPGGVGIASADYADLVREARLVLPHTQFFSSQGRPLIYRGAYSGQAASDGSKGIYRLWVDGKTFDVQAPFCGEYGAENAIAIASVAHVLGVSTQEIIQGFAAATLPQHRFQIHTMGACVVIDDSYNANPLSMLRMLHAAQEYVQDKNFYVVLGAMGELGDSAQSEHEKIGHILAQLNVKGIFWCGAHKADVRAGLHRGGGQCPVYSITNTKDFAVLWQTHVKYPYVVLCKGSRFNKLETMVDVIMACEDNNHVL